MITADTKCVVNGDKINNEIIPALNALLNMEIIIGDVAAPEIRFTSESAQIVIPPSAGAETNEELDIVDSNNQAAKRWFLTTLEAGVGGEDTTAPKIGTSAGGDGGSTENTGREKLGGGALSNKNRDKLNTGTAPGIPLDPGGHAEGGPLRIDPGGHTEGGPFRIDPGGAGGGYPLDPGGHTEGGPFRIDPGGHTEGGPFRIDPGGTGGGYPLDPRDTTEARTPSKKEYDYGPRTLVQKLTNRQRAVAQMEKYNELMAKLQKDSASLSTAERRFLMKRKMATELYYQEQAEKDAKANERYINEQLNNQ